MPCFTDDTEMPTPSALLASAIQKRRSYQCRKDPDFRVETILGAAIKRLCIEIGQQRRKRWSCEENIPEKASFAGDEDHPAQSSTWSCGAPPNSPLAIRRSARLLEDSDDSGDDQDMSLIDEICGTTCLTPANSTDSMLSSWGDSSASDYSTGGSKRRRRRCRRGRRVRRRRSSGMDVCDVVPKEPLLSSSSVTQQCASLDLLNSSSCHVNSSDDAGSALLVHSESPLPSIADFRRKRRFSGNGVGNNGSVGFDSSVVSSKSDYDKCPRPKKLKSSSDGVTGSGSGVVVDTVTAAKEDVFGISALFERLFARASTNHTWKGTRDIFNDAATLCTRLCVVPLLLHRAPG